MLTKVLMEDTIAAVVSPKGRGGISVIRVSGPNCLKYCDQLCPFIPKNPESHRVYLGYLKKRMGELIDQALVTYFMKGRSYTGEETVEISFHGNPLIASQILNELVNSGVRIAEKGEFTYRAFMNGKLDLIQAESVLSLIESNNEKAKNLALRQLSGTLSAELIHTEEEIIRLLANIEASIDFSTEDIDPFSRNEMEGLFQSILNSLKGLLSTYRRGRLINEGIRIALVGRPNVGKSSLLNLFLQKDRAIVSEEAGTTRDTIEGIVDYEGIRFEFIDTAGIREVSNNEIERIGIERTKAAVRDVDALFLVFDISEGFTSEDWDAWESIDLKSFQKFYILGNKSDLLGSMKKSEEDPNSFQTLLSEEINNKVKTNRVNFLEKSSFFIVSSLEVGCREKLLKTLVDDFELEQDVESVSVSNARHFENLSKSYEILEHTYDEFKKGIGEEFIALRLREALERVMMILGKHYDDQILDKIFKEFCLGK